MSETRDSIASLVITVIFLVLTAIATTLYGGSAEQRAKLDQNFFWQKTRWVFDSALSTLTGLSMAGSQGRENDANGKSAAGNNSAAVGSPVASESDSGFWSKLTSSLQDAWNKSGETAAGSAVSTGNENPATQAAAGADSGFIAWDKTATGAEIVFRPKSGEEYILPLPFKFLSR